MTAAAAQPLAGKRIGVPESRQLDLLTQMLASRGACVERCALVAIRDTPHGDAVAAWLDTAIGDGLDVMIWLTGEGVTRLADFAAGRGRRDELLAVLRGAAALARGPKPGRALRALGLAPGTAAAAPTTAGVIDTLDDFGVGGARVGVQLYGREPNVGLMEALRARGATPLPVAPYVYADAADAAATVAFIDHISAGALHAVTFTSTPQVRRLFNVAGDNARVDALVAGLNGCCVAAVGPLVAEALRAERVGVDCMPAENYFMKPLVRSLVDYLA